MLQIHILYHNGHAHVYQCDDRADMLESIAILTADVTVKAITIY